MRAHLYKIHCLTSMHVGSGETNYNIIDNEVERDPVLENVPIIPSSGVKGALKEHCQTEKRLSDDASNWIFGTAKNAGSYKFLTSGLLARPLRVSQGTRSYVMATTPEILAQFQRLTTGVGIHTFDALHTAHPIGCTASSDQVSRIEDAKPARIQPDALLTQLLAPETSYAVVPSFRDYDLPVLARNRLDDGISEQLWYEEIVPHESVFFLIVLVPEFSTEDSGKYFEAFEAAILQKGPVQFGGNASIGCGYTNITMV